MRDVTDREFDFVMEQAGLPVLVEFWKPGCGNCRALCVNSRNWNRM